ncbi:MAG: MarR family winged helix-turn-helix transcriptional regulator [Pseudonocardiaceae bacterium]|jgi:DNA-binding MarR family transcriptional regulator
MGPPNPAQDAAHPSAEQVDAVLVASRALVAVAAQSVASVEDRVTLPQLRVLVMIASRGPQNLASVAAGLGVHASNGTRMCDKLVNAGLLHRSDDPTDRRNVVLQLTPSGQQLVDSMTEHRRTAIANILAKMPARLRSDLVPALLAFAESAQEIPPSEAWALGWTTEQPGGTHQRNHNGASV